MDAVEVLNKHIDIEKLLEYYKFDNVKPSGGILRCSCKIHGGSSNGFAINPENGLWYCHTSDCGGGDAYTLVQKMENVDFKTSVKRVAEVMNISIADLAIMERKTEVEAELKKWINLMRKRRIKEVVPFTLHEAKEVKAYRGFQQETIDYFGLVYIPSIDCVRADGGGYILVNRLGFPIHNEFGVQIGVSLRRIRGADHPKWSHQPRTVKTSEMLYNYDRVKGSQVIVVCEGILDVWAYHEIGVQAVCTYGAHLSDEQYKLLIRSGADIVLSYDGDKAGQVATHHAVSLLHKKANLSVIRFAENEDPENIPREELSVRYEQRVKI